MCVRARAQTLPGISLGRSWTGGPTQAPLGCCQPSPQPPPGSAEGCAARAAGRWHLLLLSHLGSPGKAGGKCLVGPMLCRGCPAYHRLLSGEPVLQSPGSQARAVVCELE